jgi:hypothetical protein
MNDKSNFKELYNQYVVPPIAGAIAIVPTYYGFVYKTAIQTLQPPPKLTIQSTISDGFKASPLVGVIVGAQLGIQKATSEALDLCGLENEFAKMSISSITSGAISSPLLVALNALTLNKPIFQSIKTTTPIFATLITIRESSFVASLVFNTPLNKQLQNFFGENKFNYPVANFISGFTCSILTHPTDTYLTCLQKGIKLQNLGHLAKGSISKGITIGLFNVAFSTTHNLITTNHQIQK